MRPDEHKAKESRKYQLKKRQQGDSSAIEAAEARKKAAKARDKGVGMSAIRRRNGDYVETEEEKEERKALQAKFAKRKITSNVERYHEETEEEATQRDAEMGIDRETTELVSMLENADEGSSTFFKFKEEQLFNKTGSSIINQEISKNLLQLDFDLFKNALDLYDTNMLLGLSDEDKELTDNAFQEHPVVLDKPIIPTFSKNAKGYVLFKSQQPAKPNVISESNGIYIRNDGSNHPKTNKETSTPQKSAPPTTDALDELLALESTPNMTNTPQKTVLPKPGAIKKPSTDKKQKEEINADDEAWLDDILG